MKEILSSLNNVIEKLENSGKIKEAEKLNNLFTKIASEDDVLFDPRQKGSDLESFYPHTDDVMPEEESTEDDVLFDPRQKGSDLDRELAKHHDVEPMKYNKKKYKVKVRRIK
jgi:hypothetical protein